MSSGIRQIVTRRSLMGLAGALVALGIVAGVVETGYGQTDVIKQRQEAMKELGGIAKKLKSMTESDAAYDREEAAKLASRAATIAGVIPDVFPEGSLDPNNSRATPEIWQDWDGFTAAAQRLEDAAKAFVLAARNGSDRETARKRFGAMGAACGGCHEDYRGPEL